MIDELIGIRETWVVLTREKRTKSGEYSSKEVKPCW